MYPNEDFFSGCSLYIYLCVLFIGRDPKNAITALSPLSYSVEGIVSSYIQGTVTLIEAWQAIIYISPTNFSEDYKANFYFFLGQFFLGKEEYFKAAFFLKRVKFCSPVSSCYNYLIKISNDDFSGLKILQNKHN